MAESFLLKDDHGRIRGYLIRRQEDYLVKLDTIIPGGRLVMAGEDGCITQRNIPCSGGEHTVAYSHRAVRAAIVDSGGKLMLTDGRGDEGSFLRMQVSRAKEETARSDGQKNGAAHSQSRAQENSRTLCAEAAADRTEEEGRCAQRRHDLRWPPPVFMMQVDYRDGAWRERESGKQGDTS